MPFSFPSFHPTPSLCPANPTFLCWARSWVPLSGSRGAECVGSGCKEGQCQFRSGIDGCGVTQRLPSHRHFHPQIPIKAKFLQPSQPALQVEASVLCCLLHFGPAMGSLECYKEADNLFPQGFHWNEGSGRQKKSEISQKKSWYFPQLHTAHCYPETAVSVTVHDFHYFSLWLEFNVVQIKPGLYSLHNTLLYSLLGPPHLSRKGRRHSWNDAKQRLITELTWLLHSVKPNWICQASSPSPAFPGWYQSN